MVFLLFASQLLEKYQQRGSKQVNRTLKIASKPTQRITMQRCCILASPVSSERNTFCMLVEHNQWMRWSTMICKSTPTASFSSLSLFRHSACVQVTHRMMTKLEQANLFARNENYVWKHFSQKNILMNILTTANPVWMISMCTLETG